MIDYALTEEVLVGANLIVYASLSYQLLRRWVKRRVRADSASGAFAVLATELKRAIPTVPLGYTWREAIQEARNLKGLDVDWNRLDRAVDAYEAHRYGGAATMDFDYAEVLTLARELKMSR